MKNLFLLSALLLAIAAPAHAMTEESSHYNGTDQRSQYADPDDSEEQFNDSPRSSLYGQSGREQQLLNNGNNDHSSTYGFGGSDSSGPRGSYYGGNTGSSTYYGFH